MGIMYASTNYRTRRDLRNSHLQTSANHWPWLVIGDFNAILRAREKMSFRRPYPTSMRDFTEMVLAAGLKDQGYKSSNYTWANNRSGQAYVAAGLDQAFCDPQWLDCCEDHIVTFQDCPQTVLLCYCLIILHPPYQRQT